MKSKKVIALILTTVIAATTLFVGCGKEQPKTDDKGTTATTEMDKEQYFNYCFITDVKTLDPSKNDDTYGGMILTDTLEPLTRVIVDKEGKTVIEPAGAKSWDISPDGLTYTFHLNDFNWEDGQKVTSKEYAYSLLRTLDPATASTYPQLIYGIKGAQAYNEGTGKAEEVGLATPDDNTLVVTLEAPMPYFIELTHFTLFVPQRKDIIEKNSSNFGAEANTVISCGPFRVKEWIHDNKVVLEKNEKYYDKDKVNLTQVNIKIIKEDEARMQEMYTGGLDQVDVVVQEWTDKFKQVDGLEQIEVMEPSVSYFIFNQTATVNNVKLFSNAKIRKAFSAAIDRPKVINLIAEGTAIEATGWIPPKVDLAGDEFRKIAEFDPVTKILEEVKDPKALFIEGLKELNADPDPSKYEVIYTVGNTSARGKKNAEVYQQMFQEKLGIKFTIDQVESAIRSQKVSKLDYQMTQMAWIGDYNDPSTFMDMWNTKMPNFKTGWANTKYDDLIKKANSITDKAERLKLYKEAEKLLIYDDVVIAPVMFNKKNQFQYKYVKDAMQPNFGSTCELKYAYIQGRGK